jgi:uncharacterized protein YdaU (DUF1376 family)
LFFSDDILAATPYWRGEERALYILLLGYQWANGPLPNDLDQLAQSVQYDPKAFVRLWAQVGQKFASTAEGWANLRLEERRTRAREISASRAAIGSKGGTASATKRIASATAIAAPKAIANVVPIGAAIGTASAVANSAANLVANHQANSQAKFNHLKKEEKNEEEESEASQGKKGI